MGLRREGGKVRSVRAGEVVCERRGRGGARNGARWARAVAAARGAGLGAASVPPDRATRRSERAPPVGCASAGAAGGMQHPYCGCFRPGDDLHVLPADVLARAAGCGRRETRRSRRSVAGIRAKRAVMRRSAACPRPPALVC